MKKVTRYRNANYFHFRILFLVFILLAIGEAGKSQTTIQGFVYDNTNQPYPGATVLLNKTKGTITNAQGHFAFQKVSLAQFQLEISAIGFNTYTISGLTDTLLNNLHVQLTRNVQELGEVDVKENVGQQIKRRESFSVQLIEDEFLKAAQASNLMQTLNVIPGISSMDVGTGISKPMIRGMSYYRVVVAQNGIKQVGQQWSNHHGISIDQHAVSHVEIIKGPASLQYGSDAIGGVINILPPSVPLSAGVTGEVSLTAKSNTQWLGGSGNFEWRKGDVYATLSLSYSSYGDYVIPYTEYFWDASKSIDTAGSHKNNLGDQLYNTAGNEKGASTTVGVVKSWGTSYLEFSYYGTQSGFFDWQGIQYDSIKAMHAKHRHDINLPYQQVKNFAINSFTKRYFKSDKLELAFGYQYNNSKEYSYLDDRTGNRAGELAYFKNMGNYDLGLCLQALSGNVFYTLKRLINHQIKFGFNTQHQVHQTNGYNHILPEYTRFFAGVFVTHNYTINPKWILNSGARLDYTVFNMDESLNPDVEFGDSIFNPAFEKKYPGTAFSLGLNFLPTQNTTLKFNAGKSFRIPSAYELGAYGLHRHQGRFEKGSIENKPEQAWQADLGIEQKWRNFTAQISPFLYYFSNYLYLNPTPTLRPEGQVYEYQQSRAMLSGAELSVNYRHRKIELNVGGEYVYAVNLDLKRALPFTPPLTIKTALNYIFKETEVLKNNKIGLALISVAAQNYTVPNELNTPGYNTINLLATTDLSFGHQTLSVMLKIRNLFNQSYFNHISFYRRMRIPEPGRDVQLFVSIPIN